jgi:2-oxoglutarate ferredoxin oxidoreductase subunit alpha
MYDMSEISSNSPIISTEEDSDYLRYLITENGISPRRVPGKGDYFVTADSDEHDEAGFITEAADVRITMVDKRMRKLDGIISELEEPEFFGKKDCDVLLVGWGSTYGPIKEAIQVLNEGSGQKFGALIFGDIYPLPTKLLLEYADKAETIINVEQNATGQLDDLIRETTGIFCNDSILKYDGRQISGEEIVSKLQLIAAEAAEGGNYE